MARALKQAGSTPKEGGQYVNVLFFFVLFQITNTYMKLESEKAGVILGFLEVLCFSCIHIIIPSLSL